MSKTRALGNLADFAASAPSPTPRSTEERLENIEARLENIEARLENIEKILNTMLYTLSDINENFDKVSKQPKAKQAHQKKASPPPQKKAVSESKPKKKVHQEESAPKTEKTEKIEKAAIVHSPTPEEAMRAVVEFAQQSPDTLWQVTKFKEAIRDASGIGTKHITKACAELRENGTLKRIENVEVDGEMVKSAFQFVLQDEETPDA